MKLVSIFILGSLITLLTYSAIDGKEKLQSMLPMIDIDSVEVTFYSPSRAETDNSPFIMADGQRVFEGAIAISRDLLGKHLRLGDYVYIQEFGIFRVCDLMNPKWTKRMDIFYFSKEQGIRIGSLRVKAYKLIA